MKFLVLGVGMMGYACIFDLLNSDGIERVTAVDINQQNLDNLSKITDSKILKRVNLDIKDTSKLSELMKDHDVVISVISYKLNYELTELAIENNCHFCDLGGNNTIVEKQYTLHNKAQKNNVTVIPDCGLAPGVVSNLAALIISRFDTVNTLKLRVGGLPQKPEPPLNYAKFFSPEGLINEYFEIPVMVRNHEIIEAEPLGDLETLFFDDFPELEAFNTSGGTSTLPKNFRTKVKNLDYKTIRYAGHCNKIKILYELGLMDYKPVKVAGVEIAPREILMYLLEKILPDNPEDVILLRVQGSGMKDGENLTTTIEIVDYYDKKSNISAMMRMTSYPLSIIAQMLARGDVKDKGVRPSELVVDFKMLIEELKKRQVNIKIY